jgi:hypothetical protein
MKFRFTTAVAGAFCGFAEGAVIEPTQIDPHVQRWLDEGVMVPVRDDGHEAAVVSAPERAVSLRRSRRRRGLAAVA